MRRPSGSGPIALLALLAGLSCSCDSPAAARARMKRWRARDFFTDPLHVRLADAVAVGDRPAIDAVVAAGADVNARGKNGMPLLVWAMAKDNVAGFEALLAHGADLTAEDGDAARKRRGERAQQVIEMVAGGVNPAFLRAALQQGFDPDYVPNPEIEESLLFQTVWTHKIANAAVLLDAGADINRVEANQQTPLHLAQRMRYFEMVAFLLDRGADPCIKDKPGHGLADKLKIYGTRGVTVEEYPHFTKVVAELKKRGLITDADIAKADESSPAEQLEANQ